MAASLAEGAEIRAATPADLADIARIMNYPPEPPMATLLGSGRSSRLGELFALNGASITLAHTTVAVVDGAVAGVLECGIQYGAGLTTGRLLRLLPRVIFILGPVTPRALYGTWLRQKVQFAPQPDAYVVGELYVDEALRNRGIGGRLLRYAEDLARACGSSRMCLETGITNPALRLYERHGYKVVATKRDAGYERMTGSPGRVLMSKDI
jgi:ribosomal protein S18 acetylase RimI-like enzyme